ncbi:hypothetical protein J6590_063027 [Homalodisca vitripennis]|nr:hypothetical protein J6590_063027 [Homalodisca vitripennis]
MISGHLLVSIVVELVCYPRPRFVSLLSFQIQFAVLQKWSPVGVYSGGVSLLSTATLRVASEPSDSVRCVTEGWSPVDVYSL